MGSMPNRGDLAKRSGPDRAEKGRKLYGSRGRWRSGMGEREKGRDGQLLSILRGFLLQHLGRPAARAVRNSWTREIAPPFPHHASESASPFVSNTGTFFSNEVVT